MMKKLSAALVVLCLSTPAFAADLANGEKINRSCALCHGAYGQGAPGKLSPRIAGMPKYYLEKAIRDYRDGNRSYPLMNKTSGLDQMTGTRASACTRSIRLRPPRGTTTSRNRDIDDSI